MAAKKEKAKPTAKGKTVRRIRTIKPLPSRVWFEMELDSETIPCEKGVSIRFDYDDDEPTICMDSHFENFSVSNILEIAEVVKVLPKLKLASMC